MHDRKHKKNLFLLLGSLKFDCRFLFRRRILFSFYMAVNLVLYFAGYFIIYQKDRAFYSTTFVLSLVGIVFWSAASAVIPLRFSAFLRHLVCLMLPYSVMIADCVNSQLKNMAYYLSQVFVYFSLGTLFLLFDVMIEHSPLFNRRVKCGIVAGCSISSE